MAKSSLKLVLYGILLVLLFIGLIDIIIGSTNKTFMLELMGLVVLLLLSLMAFAGYSASWGERVFFVFFMLYLVNIFLLWLLKGKVSVTLSFIAIVGFLLSFPWESEPKEKPDVAAEVTKKSKTQTTVALSPKRKRRAVYVGSIDGRVYHHRSCEWVNNIKKKVWFKSKKDAQKKKYKRHKCVK